MKAMVMEIKDKEAVVITKDGTFLNVKNCNYAVGGEIELPKAKIIRLPSISKIASIAAAIILVSALGMGGILYVTPYSYVDLDINPSLEITSNVFNRILSVKALNKDGNKLIENADLHHRNLKEGIKIVMFRALEEGYLKSKENNAVFITVSTQNNKKVEKIQKMIEKSSNEELTAQNLNAEIIVENTSLEKHLKANKEGISAGKLILFEKLKEKDPTAELDDVKNTSVKKIIRKINEQKQEKEQGKREKEENKLRNKDIKGKIQKEDEAKENKEEKKENPKLNGKTKENKNFNMKSNKASDIIKKSNKKEKVNKQENPLNKVKVKDEKDLKDNIKEKTEETLKPKPQDKQKEDTEPRLKKHEKTRKKQ